MHHSCIPSSDIHANASQPFGSTVRSAGKCDKGHCKSQKEECLLRYLRIELRALLTDHLLNVWKESCGLPHAIVRNLSSSFVSIDGWYLQLINTHTHHPRHITVQNEKRMRTGAREQLSMHSKMANNNSQPTNLYCDILDSNQKFLLSFPRGLARTA